MKKFRIISTSLFLLLILCTATGIGPASASSLVITPSETVSLEAGESVEISLGVDELPEGLSGYILTVAIENPAVAEISAVSFPAWACLPENSALPASSVQIKAAELNRKVQAGASDVPLATLTLRGVEGGDAKISVAVRRMESDYEKMIILDGAKNPSPKDDPSNPENKQDEDKKDEESKKVKTGTSGSFGGTLPAENPETEEIEVPAEAENKTENKTEENLGQENEAENPPAQGTAYSLPGNELTKPENDLPEKDNTKSENSLPGFGFVGTVSVLLLIGLIMGSKR